MQEMCTCNVSFYIPWLLFSDNEPTNTYTWLYKNVGIFADEEYIFVKMKWLSDRKNDYWRGAMKRIITTLMRVDPFYTPYLSLMVKYRSRWLWILHNIYTHLQLMAFKMSFRVWNIHHSITLCFVDVQTNVIKCNSQRQNRSLVYLLAW